MGAARVPTQGHAPRRWLSVLFIVIGCYILLYICLTRVSMAVHRTVGAEGFYYVPVTPGALGRSKVLETVHVVLTYVFYPVWYIDHVAFDRSYPGCAPFMELAPPSEGQAPGPELTRP